MRRRLKQESFLHKAIIAAIALCFLTLSTLITRSFAQTIQNGDKVEENTELTYYLTATADGIDAYGVSSENGEIAQVQTNTLKITDVLPDRLEFIGFETTSTGKFGAVSQADRVTACGGTVIDDTQEEGTAEGHWNDDQSEYYYHGLHFTPADRKVSYQVSHLQAGCELTIGVKVKTPTILDGQTRYDFYNTAKLDDEGSFKNSNTVHFWMGRGLQEYHNIVHYEFDGDIPENAPEPPETMEFGASQCVYLAAEPLLDGYTFSGWTEKGRSYHYPNNYFCASSGEYTFVGHFTPNEEPQKYTVSYEIEGEKPSDYIAPSSKQYSPGKTVSIDSLENGAKINAYTFNGWTSETIDTSANSFVMPESDVFIKGSFAHDTYTLSYEFFGDAPENAASLLPESKEYEAGELVEIADAPSAEGWEFLGWNPADGFEMPEEDTVITGQWRLVHDSFEPKISKVILDPKNVYYKNDTISQTVTVENNNDYRLLDVVLIEENDETIFLPGEGYTVINDHMIEITVIDPNSSININLQTTVEKDETATVEDKTSLISALAEGPHSLNTDINYEAITYYDTDGQSAPQPPADDDKTPDTPNNPGKPEEYSNNPNTSDKIVLSASLLILCAAVTLFIVGNNRRSNHFKLIALALALPSAAGLSYSIANNLSYAKQHSAASISSQHANYQNNEANSWNLEKTIQWSSADTAALTLTFRSISAQKDLPEDVVIAIPNDAYTTREDFADYKEQVMSFANEFLQKQNNRIGILSIDSEYNNHTPRVKLAPTSNLAEIESAIDRIVEHDYEFSNFNVVPLEAAKLILSAQNDGVERVPIAISLGDHLYIHPDCGDALEQARQLVPELRYRASFKVPYTLSHGFADTLYYNGSLKEMSDPNNYFDIELTDVFNTDDFEIVEGPYFFDNYQHIKDGSQEYIHSSSLSNEDSKLKLTVNNLPSGSRQSIRFMLRLKNPNSTEHQSYTPNKKLSFDITLKDYDYSEIAHEHYDLDDAPEIINGFRLSYDANTPSGCEASVPDYSIHNAATIVQNTADEITCPGYRFAGWRLDDNEIKQIGSSSFVMPEDDVTLHATWIKSNIKKSMDGTLSEGNVAYIDNSGYTGFNSKIKNLGDYYQIEKIKNADSLPDNFDIGNPNNTVSIPGSDLPVYAWYDSEEKTVYLYTDATKVSVVGYASSLLSGFSNLKDISAVENWDTSKATHLGWLFQNDSTLTDISPVKNWNTSNVTDMTSLLQYAYEIEDISPLANWNTSNVTNLSSAFATTKIADLEPLRNWNTSKVTDMSYMFGDTKITSVAPLANWNTSNVTTMNSMFRGTALESLSGLENWNVSNLTVATSMFRDSAYGANGLSDISALANWQPKTLHNLDYMFHEQTKLENISALESWKNYSSSFYNLEHMFYYTGITDLTPLKDWDVSNTGNFTSLFANTKITSLEPLSNWRIKQNGVEPDRFPVTIAAIVRGTPITSIHGVEHWLDNLNMNLTIDNAFSETQITGIDALDSWKDHSYLISSMTSTFYNDDKLTDISGLANWTTNTRLRSLNETFSSCDTLSDLSPLLNFDVSNVTNLYSVFSYSKNISSLQGLQNWNTGSVTNLGNAFAGLDKVTTLEQLSNWNVKNVTNMGSTFSSMTSLSDISALRNWSTDSLQNLRLTFADDVNISSMRPLDGWNVSKVTDYWNIFRGIPDRISRPIWY